MQCCKIFIYVALYEDMAFICDIIVHSEALNNCWKFMIRNHLLILPSSWNNSINVPDKLCYYRETTFLRFVSCIADGLPLQKSQLLCWLLWIAPSQDVCFLPCSLHVEQGKRHDWLWFELFSYWWGITVFSLMQGFLTCLWKY